MISTHGSWDTSNKIMEYLQFGFAAAFCVLLYTDHRRIIKELSKSLKEYTKSVAELMQYVREKNDTR